MLKLITRSYAHTYTGEFNRPRLTAPLALISSELHRPEKAVVGECYLAMFTRRTREVAPDKSLLIRPVDEVAQNRCRFVCFCCKIAFVIHVYDLEDGMK